MGDFYESVNNEPYGHFAIGVREMSNEVHCKIIPRFSWYGKGLEEAVRHVGGVFGGLTSGSFVNGCGNLWLEFVANKMKMICDEQKLVFQHGLLALSCEIPAKVKNVHVEC